MRFTDDELQLISEELDMVKEGRQLSIEDGVGDADKYRQQIALIESINQKITAEQLNRQVKKTNSLVRRSKWDRFRTVALT